MESRPLTAAPVATSVVAGYPLWSDAAGAVEVRFVGRSAIPLAGGERSREATLRAVEAAAPPVAALRQVHSASLVEAETAGFHGRGDALWTARDGLALSVITADCVPVLLAAGTELLAVHAGWRGIVAGVVPAALARLSAAGTAAGVTAWIGPAIGPCCYEVGEEVAAQVSAAAGVDVATPGPRGKPHLDLKRAVEAQLRRGGVPDVRLLGPCTRCTGELLWSYRREGEKAGRNIAFIWRRADL
ncbi:MAG TPA: polyphenol oxidase family protein [Thermoanaerobaculia bacterium]|nr:polyphenol oxidase family protein [Thermoanaerobaculia bacterium]